MRGQVHYHEIVPTGIEISKEHEANVYQLLYKLNAIRFQSDIPMRITSGYRTPQHHRNVYQAKGIPEDKIPWGSMHLIGAAADIIDPHERLQKWISENITFIETIDLYFESFSSTPNYVHAQIYPPASRSRFFLP